MKLREEEFYEQYHQHGGTTIIPTEIFNELYDDATEEIERLNNIINELEKSWKEEITRLNNFIQEDSSMIEINNIREMLIQEREKDLYKLNILKGSDKE